MRATRYANAADTVELVGTTLYGRHWQRQLARDIGFSDMTVRRWKTNRTTLPHDALEAMARVLRARETEMASVRHQLLKMPRA